MQKTVDHDSRPPGQLNRSWYSNYHSLSAGVTLKTRKSYLGVIAKSWIHHKSALNSNKSLENTFIHSHFSIFEFSVKLHTKQDTHSDTCVNFHNDSSPDLDVMEKLYFERLEFIAISDRFHDTTGMFVNVTVQKNEIPLSFPHFSMCWDDINPKSNGFT